MNRLGASEESESYYGSDPLARSAVIPWNGEEIPSYTKKVEPILTRKHVEHLNKTFATAGIEDLLRWCAVSLPNLVQMTSFGPTGMVILHYMHKLGMRVPTIYLDTLHHFDESLKHARMATAAYDVDLRVYHCLYARDEAEFISVFHAERMWETDSARYDRLVKVEPMERALCELDVEAWITGRRASQGDARERIEIFEIDPVDGRLKINPLAHWSYQQVWETIRRENILYNPLHDLGYKSIGDKYTTRPVAEGESERAGRFVQQAHKTECGIHNRPNVMPRSRRARERWLRLQSASSPAVLVETLDSACQSTLESQ